LWVTATGINEIDAFLMDKREQILQRLVEIAAAVPGVNTAVRNQDELSERKRPAIAVFDGRRGGRRGCRTPGSSRASA
jgi:hypothetical protein